MEMQRLVSPNSWSCMPTALAMLVGQNIQNVLDTIGHDGSMIEWPELPEPYCRRSFAINEIIFAAFEYGYGLVEVNQTVNYHPNGEDEGSKLISVPRATWESDVLGQHDALLLGTGHSGVSHAVAWNHERQLIYDPNGCRYNLGLFGRELVYALVRVRTEVR